MVPSPMPVTMAAVVSVSLTKYSALMGSKNFWPISILSKVLRRCVPWVLMVCLWICR